MVNVYRIVRTSNITPSDHIFFVGDGAGNCFFVRWIVGELPPAAQTQLLMDLEAVTVEAKSLEKQVSHEFFHLASK